MEKTLVLIIYYWTENNLLSLQLQRALKLDDLQGSQALEVQVASHW